MPPGSGSGRKNIFADPTHPSCDLSELLLCGRCYSEPRPQGVRTSCPRLSIGSLSYERDANLLKSKESSLKSSFFFYLHVPVGHRQYSVYWFVLFSYCSYFNMFHCHLLYSACAALNARTRSTWKSESSCVSKHTGPKKATEEMFNEQRFWGRSMDRLEQSLCTSAVTRKATQRHSRANLEAGGQKPRSTLCSSPTEQESELRHEHRITKNWRVEEKK